MSLFRHKYRIESARLKNWDYSNPEAYFITICVKSNENYFGEIEIDNKFYSIDKIRDVMELNSYGKIVEEEWIKTGIIRRNAILDEFVVMPNHFHGIICLTDYPIEMQSMHPEKTVETHCMRLDKQVDALNASLQYENKFGPQSNNLSSIIRGFKSVCTNRIREAGLKTFSWQSRFHDHIIRDDKAMNKIRDYIIHNPIKWKFDKYNLHA